MFTYTLEFLLNVARMVAHGLPLLLGLCLVIAGLAVAVGRQEGWSLGDSLYFGFITATTVGYGDFRPTHGRGKFLAILIAPVGLVMTGIIVALAVQAASVTSQHLHAAS